MFGSNEDYFRARAEDFIKSRETVDKGCLEAKMLQRRSSVEAMKQRYNTMQRFSTDNNALYIARKCRQCVEASIIPYWQPSTGKWNSLAAKELIIVHRPAPAQAGYRNAEETLQFQQLITCRQAGISL